MEGTRNSGLIHLYLEECFEREFSFVGVGLAMRALGHKLRVCLVDSSGSGNTLLLFFHKVLRSEGESFHLDFFSCSSKSLFHVGQANLQAEQYASFEDFCERNCPRYDLVVFDLGAGKIADDMFSLLVSYKGESTELVLCTHERNDFELCERTFFFDLVSEFSSSSSSFSSPLEVSKLIVTGNGKGKSTFCFGFLLFQLLSSVQTHFIYFDKGGDFYGERVFFDLLVRRFPELFSYSVSGGVRFDGGRFRFENGEGDFEEAQRAYVEALSSRAELLIVDEFNTLARTELLRESELLELMERKGRLVSSGRFAPSALLEKADLVLEILESKHYCYDGEGVRKGIDF
ncbi:cob(I)yrinic acid a,c-diamide adenosyltransferase [Candidatus Woesearchaeota archaeon]|nr:cob(I)yrinic acid a,c-diamide adenosyltransferase [Nanoarchaeota archaeon]MCB9370477.1 cob(I)yrinic acid a,c-diamide adenosyltransferase [Candidatus Woesearchaeota archaeon]USN43555.1 MAG: cob(I)yrinic acid a,c-diamide adenosyltransferase [Candidatus Woesearchaeota archaeon]